MERYCEFCFMVYESPKKKKEHLQTEYHVKKEKRARREENFENYIQQHYPQMMSQYKGTTLVHLLGNEQENLYKSENNSLMKIT